MSIVLDDADEEEQTRRCDNAEEFALSWAPPGYHKETDDERSLRLSEGV